VARVNSCPFPIKVQTNVKGSGQECPLHMIYAIRGELPDAVVARIGASGSLRLRSGQALRLRMRILRRIRMLRSG
jgi:hypothetical protein